MEENLVKATFIDGLAREKAEKERSLVEEARRKERPK